MRYASEPAKTDFASEAGHWYLPNGEPYYTIIGANGKERPVTLRDARKVGAYPSVTGILKCADKPALTRYFVKQAVMASLTLPRIAGESDDDYIARILTDSKQEGVDARDTGTLIHGAIEKYDVEGEWGEWVCAAHDKLPLVTWLRERSFACPMGYGGKVDLHCQQWIVDVKTKGGPAEGRKLWDEEIMQLAAYRYGLNLPSAQCGILHVDRNRPTAELIEASEDDLQRGWEMFKALLAFWYARTGLKIAA